MREFLERSTVLSQGEYRFLGKKALPLSVLPVACMRCVWSTTPQETDVAVCCHSVTNGGAGGPPADV